MQQVEQIEQYDQSDVEKVVEETGFTDVKAILDEAVHHDVDDNQQLDIDELRSAAEVVMALKKSKKELRSHNLLCKPYQTFQWYRLSLK